MSKYKLCCSERYFDMSLLFTRIIGLSKVSRILEQFPNSTFSTSEIKATQALINLGTALFAESTLLIKKHLFANFVVIHFLVKEGFINWVFEASAPAKRLETLLPPLTGCKIIPFF